MAINNNTLYLANDSLNFPASDMELVNADNVHAAKINFMSLLSSDSPLPHYLLSAAQQPSSQNRTLKLLLKTINQRIYELFFETLDNKSNKYLGIINTMSEHRCSLPDRPPINITSLFLSSHPTKKNLECLLKYYCPGLKIIAINPQLSWIHLNNRNILGTTTLSYTSTLGNKALSNSHCIEIVVHPLHPKKFMLSNEIKEIIKTYLGSQTSIQLTTIYTLNNPTPWHLGTNTSLLAWNTCLGTPSQLQIKKTSNI